MEYVTNLATKQRQVRLIQVNPGEHPQNCIKTFHQETQECIDQHSPV